MEEGLPSPFADVAPNLSESELRETAYEILVGACRSAGPKPLTFISQSNRGDGNAVQSTSSGSLQRSLTWRAVNKVKKAVGLKTTSSGSRQAGTRGELMRVQMRVSELTDTRIRRALLRLAAGQVSLSHRLYNIIIMIFIYYFHYIIIIIIIIRILLSRFLSVIKECANNKTRYIFQ